ncbi:glutaredoxin domain-containing protein [Actinoplanes sp. CA-142083]|uniref:glutaredoxin domain-containing protein n=1 Tax=Actinoplanes sp. CA-142083 TaxID=3239903 RepID=UPI003D8E61EC
MLRRWGLSGVLFALAVTYGGSRLLDDRLIGAVLLFGFFAGIGFVVSPWMFPRSVSAAEATRLSAADGRPIVYWRLRCPWCLRLRWALRGEARRLHWVDVWKDPSASVDAVPTVELHGTKLINPTAAAVRELVR